MLETGGGTAIPIISGRLTSECDPKGKQSRVRLIQVRVASYRAESDREEKLIKAIGFPIRQAEANPKGEGSARKGQLP
jgi:hypothetical protein